MDIIQHCQYVQDESVRAIAESVEEDNPSKLRNIIMTAIAVKFVDSWLYDIMMAYGKNYNIDLSNEAKQAQTNYENWYKTELNKLPQKAELAVRDIKTKVTYDMVKVKKDKPYLTAKELKLIEHKKIGQLTEGIKKDGRWVNINGRKYNYEKYVKNKARDEIRDKCNAVADRIARQFNTDVFQISSHGGPRPLCAPFQGAYVGDSHRTEAVNGKELNVLSWSETSYGNIAGLFGKNCRHFKIPVPLYYPEGQQPLDKPFTIEPLENFIKKYG